MRLTILATLLALSATMAVAQTKDTMGMTEGLTMLESSTANILKQYGFDIDVMSLTLNQLAEIKSVMTSTTSDIDIKTGIEAALRR